MAAPNLEPEKNKLWEEAYREGLSAFLGSLERADRAGKLDDQENFASALQFALTRFGFQAQDLANDEKISKAAISKWMHMQARPTAPTRKTVINWILQKGRAQLAQLSDCAQTPQSELADAE